MKKLQTIPLEQVLDESYQNINSLIKKNIENKSIPFIKDRPFPQDMNIVSGTHLESINKLQLELKAALIGAKNLKWIYAQDAVSMGLELKNQNENIDTSPIIAFRQIARNKNDDYSLEAQSIYLLDQFTKKSIERALKTTKIEKSINLTEDENSIKNKIHISKNMIKNFNEYDTGKKESIFREQKINNLNNNFSNPLIKDSFNKISSFLNEAEINVFKQIYNYTIFQETGKKITPLLKEAKIQFINNLKNLSSQDSTRLTNVLLEGTVFADRLTHYNFDYNYVYSQDDLNKKLNVFAPLKMKYEERVKYNPNLKRQPDISKEIKEPEHEYKRTLPARPRTR